MLTRPDHQLILHSPELKISSKFGLITLVRKRAMQIVDGSPPLTDIDSPKPVSIALHEIAQGLVTTREPGSKDPVEETLDAQSSEAQALAEALGLGGR